MRRDGRDRGAAAVIRPGDSKRRERGGGGQQRRRRRRRRRGPRRGRSRERLSYYAKRQRKNSGKKRHRRFLFFRVWKRRCADRENGRVPRRRVRAFVVFEGGESRARTTPAAERRRLTGGGEARRPGGDRDRRARGRPALGPARRRRGGRARARGRRGGRARGGGTRRRGEGGARGGARRAPRRETSGGGGGGGGRRRTRRLSRVCSGSSRRHSGGFRGSVFGLGRFRRRRVGAHPRSDGGGRGVGGKSSGGGVGDARRRVRRGAREARLFPRTERSRVRFLPGPGPGPGESRDLHRASSRRTAARDALALAVLQPVVFARGRDARGFRGLGGVFRRVKNVCFTLRLRRRVRARGNLRATRRRGSVDRVLPRVRARVRGRRADGRVRARARARGGAPAPAREAGDVRGGTQNVSGDGKRHAKSAGVVGERRGRRLGV